MTEGDGSTSSYAPVVERSAFVLCFFASVHFEVDLNAAVTYSRDGAFNGPLQKFAHSHQGEDAAEALVMAGSESSTNGESYNVPGAEVTTPRQWLQLVSSVAGTKTKIRTVPKFMIALAGISNPQAREFYEMLYLRKERFILDGTKFRNKFGMIPATPYKEGIKKTLDWFLQTAT